MKLSRAYEMVARTENRDIIMVSEGRKGGVCVFTVNAENPHRHQGRCYKFETIEQMLENYKVVGEWIQSDEFLNYYHFSTLLV